MESKEEEIRKIYQKPMFMFLGSGDLISISMMILLLVILSFSLGSPFFYKVKINMFDIISLHENSEYESFMEDVIYMSHNEGTFTFDVWKVGWFFNHSFLFFIMVVTSIGISFMIRRKMRRERLGFIEDILYKNCDTDTFLEYCVCGLNYLPDRLKRPYKKQGRYIFTYFYFEGLYVNALCAKNQYEKALQYMEESWKMLKKININYKLIKQKLRLKVAYEQKNLEGYEKLLRKTSLLVKYSKNVRADRLVLQKEYSKAIKVLGKIKPKNCYEEVCKFYRLGECYIKLGNQQQAKDYLDFVLENGNNTGIKEKALEFI